jgi:hypothetical protein
VSVGCCGVQVLRGEKEKVGPETAAMTQPVKQEVAVAAKKKESN